MGTVTRALEHRKPVTFYDSVYFEGATNRIIIEDGTIKGFTSIVGADLYSDNWDGTIPINLSAEDTGATVGYAFDGSVGAAQMMGNFWVGGDIFLTSGAALHTAADGVDRIEIGGASDSIDWYNAADALRFTIDLDGSDNAHLFATAGDILINGNGHVEVNADAKTAGTLTLSAQNAGGGSIHYDAYSGHIWDNSAGQTMELRYNYLTLGDGTSDNVPKMIANGDGGTALLPHYTFYGDEDTGAYRSAANQYALTAGGNLGFDLYSSGRIDLHGSAQALYFYSRDNDDQPMIVYNPTGDELRFYVASDEHIFNASGYFVQSGNKIEFSAAGPAVSYINEGWGIELRGDSSHPIQVLGTALTLGVDVVASGTRGAGYIHSVPGTTGTAANMTMLVASGSEYYWAHRDTSSRRYKEDIDYDVIDYLASLELKPSKFYRPDDDREWFGLIAEDVDDQDPLLTNEWEEDGGPANWNTNSVVTVLAAQVIALQEDVKALQRRLTKCPDCGILSQPTTHGEPHATE
jgi:hypothetical protein